MRWPNANKDETLGVLLEDGGGNKIGNANPLPVSMSSGVVTDVASAAVTASGNSGTIAADAGNSLGAVVNVTAVSGTNPTLDVVLQQSLDNGVTWSDVFHLPRFTGTGTGTVPNIQFSGRRRWVWTIGGTNTPSFTFSIIVNKSAVSVSMVRQFFDRTIDPNTINSTTPTYFVAGVTVRGVSLKVKTLALTTAATFQLQVSDDGVNWMWLGSTIAPSANLMGMVSLSASAFMFVRAIVTVAGSGESLSYVSISSSN